jgi:type IV pilus assembly protein PilQ
MALAASGAAPQRAGAADEMTAMPTSELGSAVAEGRIPSVTAAKRLLGIEAERTEGGTILRLRADGEISNARTMVLENPTRLVLDLPGIKNGVGTKRIDVDSAFAARVRVGQHEEKLRVVVDGGSMARPFEGHVVVPRQDGVWVGLGSEAARLGTSAAPEALASTPARQSAPVGASGDDTAPLGAPSESTPASQPPVTGSVRVSGVQYDAQVDRDRLVIVQEGTAPHSVLRPDAETLVVSLQDAVLDPGATIRITPQEPGPISLVTAIQMPNASVPEVRIAIARAPGAEPTVTQEGQFLVLDFPRVGKKGEAAAAFSADPGRVEQIAHQAAAATRTAAPATKAASAPPAAAAGTGAPTDLLKEGGLIGGKNYTGRRISLDFKDVEIADVLRLIAEVSDLNVIAGDEVKGTVTIRLTDVPWDQALDVILLTKGLGFVLVGNVLRIAPADVLKAEVAARLEDRRAQEKLEDLVVKIHPVNYSSVSEVETMVKKLLTSRGSVNIDKRTNTLILKDIQSVVDESVALVKAVDTPTPQVLIESKIVEAKLDFSRELGAVWGIGSNPDVDGIDGGRPPQETVGGNTFPFQQPNNVVVSNPITSTANGLLNLGGYILNDRFNLTLQLQAAESNGEGKVISSPRVVTLDNREAKIEQGVSIPFQTFENGDAQLEFIDAVLSLLVTPHITADKSIIMKIMVTRNAPDPSVPTPTGSPAIAKNEAKTETMVKNGQTLVLGGIYTVDRSETQSRVPYLYRIPIIGNAFKNNQVLDKRRELLIFVTPRIVEAQTAQN